MEEEKDSPSSPPSLDLEKLRAIKVLGKGAMGTVFLAHDTAADPAARQPFALKVVEKSYASSKPDADRRARWEIAVLRRLTHPSAHPFLPTITGTAESRDLLAWAVPYCPGGDLNVLRHRQTDGVFSPAAIRFYAAEIVTALDHLHGLGIVYRDLKPENVLIQQSGHVTLTDFDLSRSLTHRTVKSLIAAAVDPAPAAGGRRRPRRRLSALFAFAAQGKSSRVSPVSRRKHSLAAGERSNSFVGTDEYVAPEVVRGDGHEFAVDWWALGVLLYEMLYGATPFRGKNRKETFRNVVARPPEFVGKQTALTDLIGRLLEKEPTRRLGYQRGAAGVKEHEFFRGLRWDLLTDVLRPPFLPSRDDGSPAGKLTAGGIDVVEYFEALRAPPSSIPPSPLPSPSHDCCRRQNVSFTEF